MRNKMKKLIVTMVTCIALAVPAMSAFAANTTYTKDAKDAYPNNYADIYGVSLDITMGESGFYLSSLTIGHNDITKADKVFCSDSMKDYTGGFNCSDIESADYADGASATFTYKSSSPLFSGSDTTITLTGVDPGHDFTVNGITWLDKDGKKLEASEGGAAGTDTTTKTDSKDETPKTGNVMNMTVIGGILVIAAAGFFYTSKRYKSAK